MRGEDRLVNFAGGESIFVANDGAEDDVSIVKPQVGAFVRLYVVARFAFVYPWPLCGKE
jgi:hypothetical protein